MGGAIPGLLTFFINNLKICKIILLSRATGMWRVDANRILLLPLPLYIANTSRSA